MADIYKKIRGTIETAFRIGLGRASIRSQAGDILEVRKSDDSGYGIMRGAAPVGDSDYVTKKYADTLEKPLIVKRQADCSVAIPANTGVRGFVVVTTAGSGANIGDILYDDGSGVGTMEILAAVEGRTIAVSDALTGGTISFEPDSIYIWDDDNSEWDKIGDIGSVTGARRVMRFTVDNSAAQNSVNEIPQNARVLECTFEVTTPYSGGATVSIGYTGAVAAFQATTDNLPQTAAAYVVDQDTLVPSDQTVLVTVSGAPAAGAGVVIVEFSSPLA